MDWSRLSTKVATQVSEFSLLTVTFVWVDYRSGMLEKNANKVRVSGLQFECCSSRTGNYNAFGCGKGRIESVLRVMVVFLTTYEFQI
jgi:enoyl-[acyl-carrier-protein] reductase (NADH)